MSKKIWVLDIERELTPNLVMGALKCSEEISVISVYQNHNELSVLLLKIILLQLSKLLNSQVQTILY